MFQRPATYGASRCGTGSAPIATWSIQATPGWCTSRCSGGHVHGAATADHDVLERPAVVASWGLAGLPAVGVNVTSMKLEMMTEEDVELRVRLETDPQMMAELGG